MKREMNKAKFYGRLPATTDVEFCRQAKFSTAVTFRTIAIFQMTADRETISFVSHASHVSQECVVECVTEAVYGDGLVSPEPDKRLCTAVRRIDTQR
jgi:hypothetical protein